MSRFLVALFAAMTMVCGVARADTVILTGDVWCPHNCEADASRPGYLVEIARAVFEPLGHRVEYRVRPWRRAIKETAMGVSTAVIGVTAEEADGLTERTGPVGMIDFVFATRDGSDWTWAGVDSPAGRRLGVGDYSFTPEIDAFIASHPRDTLIVRGERPMEILMRRLDTGDVNVVLDDRSVLRVAADRAGLPIRIAGNSARVPLTLGFLGTDPDARFRARAVDEGVSRLRASGELARILASYGMTDWEGAAVKP